MRSLTSLAVLATMLFATSAHAGFGVRLGAGTGFLQTDNDYEPDSISAWTVGAAYKLDLTVLELEIDALWKSTTVTGVSNKRKFPSVHASSASSITFQCFASCG